MIYTGRHGDYAWIASHDQRSHVASLLRTCPKVTLGKFVAITAFDSGPLEPSARERKAGWSFDGRVMLSPRITAGIEIPHGQFDEWLIFSRKVKQLPELEVFINCGGFSFADERDEEQCGRLWAQLERVGAESYLAEGDNFLFATKDAAVFACVESTLRAEEPAAAH